MNKLIAVNKSEVRLSKIHPYGPINKNVEMADAKGLLTRQNSDHTKWQGMKGQNALICIVIAIRLFKILLFPNKTLNYNHMKFDQ